MAMSYTTLVADAATEGSIKYAINWSRIDAPGILEEAQAWIYSKLRVQEMIASATVTIAAAASTADLPTRYLDPIHFGIPGYVRTIKLIDQERFRAGLGWDTDAALPEGVPTRWTNIGSAINLDVVADQEYSARMAFFQSPALLAADNDTNWLTQRYPSLLRRVCLMFAAEARKEFAYMDRCELKALELIDQAKTESDLAFRGLELDFNWESN